MHIWYAPRALPVQCTSPIPTVNLLSNVQSHNPITPQQSPSIVNLPVPLRLPLRGVRGHLAPLRPQSLVLAQVSVEVRLLTEAAVAEGAAEGPLALVDVAHVALQVRRDGERTLAVLATVRLLAGVRAQVTRQVG